MTAPAGPIRQRRDFLLKKLAEYNAGVSPAEAEIIIEGWGDHFQIMAYDAAENVEDWWRKYGASIIKCPHQDSSVGCLKVAVATQVPAQVTAWAPI